MSEREQTACESRERQRVRETTTSERERKSVGEEGCERRGRMREKHRMRGRAKEWVRGITSQVFERDTASERDTTSEREGQRVRGEEE